jgi:hypothetical protein
MYPSFLLAWFDQHFYCASLRQPLDRHVVALVVLALNSHRAVVLEYH